MPSLTSDGKVTNVPRILDYRNIGTAAGTTNICPEPCYIEGIQVTTRKASGVFTIFDSGTNTNPVGTITLGTNTADDPPYIPLNFRLNTGLTIGNAADFGGIVKWGK